MTQSKISLKATDVVKTQVVSLFLLGRRVKSFLLRRRNREVSRVYVFCFFGEFGYELLNWQGRIRYLKSTNPLFEYIVIGRRATKFLYEDALDFIPLDEVSRFQASKANGYFADYKKTRLGLLGGFFGSLTLRNEVRALFRNRHKPCGKKHRFIFSDHESTIGGVQFGASRILFGWPGQLPPDYNDCIYSGLDLQHNRIISLGNFSKPNLKRILIMRASRSSVVRDQELIDDVKICEALEKRFPVTYMEFKSQRKDDTVGNFSFPLPKHTVVVSSLEQQLEEISRHDLCVFFSEGDLRSHTYIPPLAGVNVIVVTTAGVANSSNYIEYWNKSVFKYGASLNLYVWSKDNRLSSLMEEIESALSPGHS